MKKIILGVTVLIFAVFPLISPRHHHAHGRGDSGAAAVAGLAGGMILGTAIAGSNDGSGKARRAEEEARRAQDKTEQLRNEQQQDKLQQLQREMDKKEMERIKVATEQQPTGPSLSILYLLIGLVAMLFFAVVGLGIMVLHKRP